MNSFYTVVLFRWFNQGICQLQVKERERVQVNNLED